MVPAALGTQVVGSIIRPAAFSANVAIKPSFGALNRGERQGLSQSCLGVHAGSVEDMWHVAAEIAARAGGDPGYPGLGGTLAPPPPRRPNRLIVLESEGWEATGAPTRATFAALLAQLQAAGTTLLRRGDDRTIGSLERSIADAVALSSRLVAYESRWTYANLLRLFPEGLSDTTRALIREAAAMTPADYREMLALRAEARLRHAAVAALADGVVTLSCTGPAPLRTVVEQQETGRTGNPGFNAWTSLLGCPAVTLPLLGVEGMPVGVQLVGQPQQDEQVVAMARWLAATATPVNQ
jgi:Asp-tRNA(Asn)/Glu-tRNA(Gln) amidotransferase A subunit family amidase